MSDETLDDNYARAGVPRASGLGHAPGGRTDRLRPRLLRGGRAAVRRRGLPRRARERLPPRARHACGGARRSSSRPSPTAPASAAPTAERSAARYPPSPVSTSGATRSASLTGSPSKTATFWSTSSTRARSSARRSRRPLRWLKIDTLLLAGVTTSGCVRASCVDSISHGFVTVVVEDAVGDRDPGPHAANLYDMSAKYADLCTTNEAIAYLRSVRADA